MRIKLIWTILASGTICLTSPSHAQTFDPNYPVCIEITEWGGTHIDCSYTSMPPCQMTASNNGRCFANPYSGSRSSRIIRRIGGADCARFEPRQRRGVDFGEI